MNTRKKFSVFQQILIVNLVLSLLFICTFIVNSVYSSIAFRQETEKRSQQILNTMVESYQSESVRLTTFLELCVKDRSFVLGLSNRLTTKELIEYGKQVSEKLSIMQYSFPYAENVYAYVKNAEKFIMPQNAMMGKDIFMTTIQQKYGLPNEIPDFGSMEDGFHKIENNVFYVYQIYDYGTLIIKVDPDIFCKLSEVAAVLPDYRIAVLDANCSVFAGDETVSELLDPKELVQDSRIYTEYQGQEYYVNHALLPDGYHFILAENCSDIGFFQGENGYIYIIGGVMLFFGCALLVFLNTKIYRPLQTIAKQYLGPEKRGNEFELIHAKIDEMIDENRKMQTQVVTGQQLELDMQINYAILSKHPIHEKLAEQLKKQYGEYRVISVAMQNQAGTEESLQSADDYFVDALEGKVIRVNQFLHVYLVPDTHSLEEILNMIQVCFADIDPENIVFIGISDISDDYTQLLKAYKQSYNRMLSNPVNSEKRYRIFSEKNDPAAEKKGKVSTEVLNTLARDTVKGSAEDIEKILKHIFFSNGGMSLKEFISCYSQLKEFLVILINQSSTADLQGFEMTDNTPLYDPSVMYERLLTNYKKLNESSPQQDNSLRYEVVEYINSHYMEPLSLDSIASVFGITSVYLSSWFKKNTGVNLSMFITNVRMKEAEKLIREHPHRKIADIAAQVGFPSITTFTRQFKNYFGCSPDQFRQKIKSENEAEGDM